MFHFKTDFKSKSLKLWGLFIVALAIPVTFNSCKGFEVAPVGGLEGEQDSGSLSTPLQDLQAVAISDNEIRLSYSLTTSGNYAFSIFRNDQYIATTVKTIFNDVGLAAGTTYTYKVFAADIDTGEGFASGVVVTSTLGDNSQQPAPPTPQPQETIAMYSYNSDLSNAKVLSGATLERQKVYFFITNESQYKEVRFYCCKGISAGAEVEPTHETQMSDVLAPFILSEDLSQLAGGKRELYLDAFYSDNSGNHKSVVTYFNLKQGEVTQPQPQPQPQPEPPISEIPQSDGWTIIRDFNNGTIGEKVDMSAQGNTRYSSDVALEGGQSARMMIEKGETGYGSWGGYLNHPTNLKEGDELWFRVYTYFPSGFDYFSYGEGGRLKFLRFHTLNSSGSNNGYNDVYIDQKGSDKAFKFIYEGSPRWADLAEKPMLPKFDTWESYEFYVKFHHKAKDDGGEAVVRFWKNGKLLKEVTDRKTLVNSSDYSQRTLLFTYWNGGAPKTQHMYVDNIVLTSQKPTNRDEKGNPYIGTSVYNQK